MKVLGFVVALILLVGIVLMCINIGDYMFNHHYTLGDAVTESWDDIVNLRINRTSKGEVYLGVDTRNGIQLKGGYTY